MVTKNKPFTSKPKKDNNLRYAEYYEMQSTFDGLFAKAQQGVEFDQLMNIILRRENILLAYRNIKGNNGSVTPGTDGLTIKDVERYTPDGLVQKVRNITKNYCPRTVRRKEIPKPYDPSKTRPLGIPCIWDRIIQQSILQVLEPICEAKFSKNSYGFRPNRSCEQAVAAAYRYMQCSHLHYVVEFDIKGFFDNVDHSKLIKQIWAMGIHDKGLIYVIKRILKAPIQLENGTIVIPETGTPQGGIISPLLANIVLNELDKWVESQWQNNPIISNYSQYTHANGSAHKSNGYRGMKKYTRLKEMRIIRYADDFRIFCRTRDQAVKTKIAVTLWLKERLRLDVSVDKTRVVNMNKQHSEFLGIKMRMRPKKDKMVVCSRVADKAVKRIKASAKERMKLIVRPQGTTEVRAIHDYNSFVMGIHNYYRMATDVSADFGDIAFEVNKTTKRLGRRLKREATEGVKNAVTDRYGKSAQLRWVRGLPIAPIGFVQMTPPMLKKRSIEKYTPEGREEIHKNLGINISMMNALMRQQLHSMSAKLADNRLSLYCAQYGKCAVTGQVFENLDDIHCHHKLPRSKGGKDNYQNLLLVHEKIHILIHATKQSTIASCLGMIRLNKEQLIKINKLRKKLENEPISA